MALEPDGLSLTCDRDTVSKRERVTESGWPSKTNRGSLLPREFPFKGDKDITLRA
jgi:hypothetical protein